MNYQLNSISYFVLNQQTQYFYNFNFFKNNFKIFKTLFFKKNNLITNNFTKSLLYHSIINTQKIFIKNFKTKIKFNTESLTHTQYAKPIQVLTLSLNKSKFKTLLFFYISFLLKLFVDLPLIYEIRTTYLYVPTALQLLPFLNFFFFKIKNF